MDALLESQIVFKIVYMLVIVAIAVGLQAVASRAIKHLLMNPNVPRGSIFFNLIKVAIWTLALLAILEPVFGVQPTAFVTALGVTSIALSLGLQTTLSNVFSGLGLMVSRDIEVGDWIEVGDYQGIVIDVNWRATTIKNLIGDTIVIPNSVLSTTTLNKLCDLSARSFVVPLDIHPEVDMAEVERDIRESVEKACEEYIDPELGIILFHQGYGPFGFRLDVRVGLKTMDDQVAARSAAIGAVSGRSWLARW